MMTNRDALAMGTPNPRVLVVDDDPMWRTLHAKQLGGIGCAVELVESAEAALHKLRVGTYELLILDIVMPGTSGLDLLDSAYMRNSTKSRRPKIIAVSSVEDRATQSRCVALGADAFLTKPVTASTMRATVRRALGLPETVPPGVETSRATRSCRYVTSCSVFPLMRSRSVLRVYQMVYCHRKFDTCARYVLASSGATPPPTLLPDGGQLPPPRPENDDT